MSEQGRGKGRRYQLLPAFEPAWGVSSDRGQPERGQGGSAAERSSGRKKRREVKCKEEQWKGGKETGIEIG